MTETQPTAAKPEPPTFIAGLDLGQASDYSALCVVERTRRLDPSSPPERRRRVRDYGVRHLHRWKLGTPYTAIVADTAKWMTSLPEGSSLVIDATGVGRPVVEMFRGAGLRVSLCPVVITGGHAVTRGDDGNYHVPKKELVSTMQTLVQARRFRIAPALPDAAALGRELQQFRVKVNALTGNETFESWRERDHDDLVLAVALACWCGEFETEPYTGPLVLNEFANPWDDDTLSRPSRENESVLQRMVREMCEDDSD